MSVQPESLDEFLGAEFEVDVATEAEKDEHDRFVVDNERKADWSLNKLRTVREQLAANAKFAADRKALIDQWETDQRASLERDEDYFLALLIGFHATILQRDERKKTVKLPGGILKARTSQTTVDIDEAEFMPWAQVARPELVRTTHAPDKRAIKEAAVKDGEVLKGCTVIPGELRFAVDTPIEEAE